MPDKRRRIVDVEPVSKGTSALQPTSLNKGLLIPQGAEKCLNGCNFVFTGELPNLSRLRAKQLVEQLGGHVTLVPDKFTTHAVLGCGVSRIKITTLDRLKPVTLPAPLEETVGQDVVQDHPEVVAPSEDIVQVTGNTRTEQSWPFNEPPNLVRHVPNANQTEQIGAPIKDEPSDASPAIDAPPTVNMTLRRQYAESWGTPQVKRGELTKIKFGVNYEKGESRLVKHEIRRRGGKVVRISEADIFVEDSYHFAQGRPPPPQTSNSRISRAQARYEDLIAQRNAFVAVRNRRLEKAKRNIRYYDSDFEETPEIEPPVDNEERSFRPPSSAVPPIMDEVASDGYASSCDEHEIHHAIIHTTKRMKPAKVKKGYLIQAKMVLRGPNGTTVNAINGKPGVTRTLRVPANTSFRQLTDVLNTAFGWAGDKEWDFLIASNLGKWSNLEPPPAQFVARVKKNVTTSILDRVDVEREAYIRAREIRLFDGVVINHGSVKTSRSGTTITQAVTGHIRSPFLGKPTTDFSKHRKYWCIAGEGHAHPEDHPGKLTNGEARPTCGHGIRPRSIRS
ncbi:hypothetical protein KCU78_g7648, partial [Aureobasidium melanogenum]